MTMTMTMTMTMKRKRKRKRKTPNAVPAPPEKTPHAVLYWTLLSPMLGPPLSAFAYSYRTSRTLSRREGFRVCRPRSSKPWRRRRTRMRQRTRTRHCFCHRPVRRYCRRYCCRYCSVVSSCVYPSSLVSWRCSSSPDARRCCPLSLLFLLRLLRLLRHCCSAARPSARRPRHR